MTPAIQPLTLGTKFSTIIGTMKLSQDIKPITYMKTHSAELVDLASKTGRPVVITQSGRASVVVQDIKSYERQRDALLLLKLLAQGVEDAEAGRVTEQDKMFARLERKLAKQKKKAA